MMKEFNSTPKVSRTTKVNRVVLYTTDFKTRLLSGFHNVRPVHLLSSVLQILFGMSVVAIALLGLITPIWVAALANFFGCLISVVGAYQMYDCFSEGAGRSNLVKESIRNVIAFRN
jgi:hypothetical protein